MNTRYQPRNLDGRSGPVFPFMTMACWWIITRESTVGWEVTPIREPLLIEIQNGLTAGTN